MTVEGSPLPETGEPNSSRGISSAAADGIAVATLSAGVWLLYGGIARLWWTSDDLAVLHMVSTRSASAFFFSPESLFNKMFMPLFFVSYAADLVLFGWSPRGFYAHHLVAFSAAAAAVYAALRSWLPPRFAWAGAGLFVLGIPSASWIVELPCRHYIEGLIWAALSAWFFTRALRARSPALPAGLSALFYFLSMLEKEVYVPLLFLLLVLPESAFETRFRRLRPHLVALYLYLAWRWVMLGTLAGGYGWAVRPREWPGLILRLPVRLAATLFGRPTVPAFLLLACLFAGVALLLRRRPACLGLLSVAAILVVAPIVPVAKAVGERFGTLLWLLVTVAFVFGCRELSSGSLRAAPAAMTLLLLAIAAAAIANRVEWRRLCAKGERMSTEGRAFLSLRPGDALAHPLIPAAAMSETRWFKEEQLRLPRGSGWYADDIYLCKASPPPGRIWEYDESAGTVRDVTRRALKAAARYCGNLRSAPMWADFESSRGSLFWTLGPYERGSYALVLEKGVESLTVAREDGYRLTPGVLSLMLRYESPEGWVTYSPELTMDFRVSARFRWERNGPSREAPVR